MLGTRLAVKLRWQVEKRGEKKEKQLEGRGGGEEKNLTDFCRSLIRLV